jgi:hypothetical protein
MWKEDHRKAAVYEKTYTWISKIIKKGAPNFVPPKKFEVGRMPGFYKRPHRWRVLAFLGMLYLFIGFV